MKRQFIKDLFSSIIDILCIILIAISIILVLMDSIKYYSTKQPTIKHNIIYYEYNIINGDTIPIDTIYYN